MNPRIFVLALSTFAFGSGALILSGLLEFLAHDLGVPVGAAGQLQTAYVLTAALAGPLLAMLVGRLERKTVLLAALATTVVLNLVCYFVDSFLHLLLLRAAIGATGAMAGPAASSAASALAPPERRGSALAVVSGGMTVAFLMGIPMGTVVGSTFGWRAAFILSAGLALVALVGIAALLPRVKPPPPSMTGRLQPVKTLPLFGSTFLAFGANMTISIYIATMVRLQTGVSGAGLGLFQLVVGLGSFVGLSLGGRAADRGFGALSVSCAFIGLAMAAGMHTLGLNHVWPPGWATYLLVGLTLLTGSTALFSVSPVVQTRLIAAAPASAPLALALNGSCASLGQALGGVAGGTMLSAVGGPGVTAASATIALTGLALWRLAGRKTGEAH